LILLEIMRKGIAVFRQFLMFLLEKIQENKENPKKHTLII
jgi:hypothetical protein